MHLKGNSGPPAFLGQPIKRENPFRTFSGEGFEGSVPDCRATKYKEFQEVMNPCESERPSESQCRLRKRPLRHDAPKIPLFLLVPLRLFLLWQVHSSPHSRVSPKYHANSPKSDHRGNQAVPHQRLSDTSNER